MGARRILLLAMVAASTAQAQTITVDLSERYQVIEGFGGFGPAKVWWDSPPYFDLAWLEKLDVLGVSVIRTQLYWDFQGEDRTFNLGPESGNGKQIEYLRELQKRGIKILATAWTPPVWMKQRYDDKLAPFCKGQCGGVLDSAHYQDFADLLVGYVERMRSAGVEIYGVSFANEPLFANPFESCVYTEKSYAAVLRVIGQTFARRGVTTQLFGPEHMGSAKWNAGFYRSVLADPDTAQYLGFYAVHGYMDGVSPDYGRADGWISLRDHAAEAGKALWMTETSDFNKRGWDKAYQMAKELHLALRFGRVSGWVYWYLAGEVIGDGAEHAPTPLYYVLKQYYRFVRPGFAQVASASDDSQILATAFSCGDALTAVLINDGTSTKAATVRLLAGQLPIFRAYRTSKSENAVAIGEVKDGTLALPAHSITTLVAWPAKTSRVDSAVETTMEAPASCEGNRIPQPHPKSNARTSTRGCRGGTLREAIIIATMAALLAAWLTLRRRT